MKRNILSELLLYRYRYFIGYALFGLLLVGALILSYIVPGQLRQEEIDSALSSATISLTDPSAQNIVNLPYHLLQKATLHYFGITTLGIKLPSLIIAFFCAIGLLWLLRKWLLRDSIALFTICICIAARLFLFTAQDGTPLIMIPFWLIFILLFALKFTANNKSLIWSVLLGASLALSMYTPLTIYVIVCLLAASILHPHLRYVISTIPKLHLFLTAFLAAIIIAPLLIALYKNPLIMATLAGWPDIPVTIELVRHNLKEITKSLFFFWRPELTETGLIPIFGASSFVLILLGVLNLIRDHHSARSYMLIMTLPIVALPSVLNPDFLIILGIPLVLLLLGLGIETLLDEWYAIFPHNPYARVTALIPMLILLGGIIIGNLTFYINAYRYSPSLAQYYNYDLNLIHDVLKDNPNAVLLTGYNDEKFYNLLTRDYPQLKVTSDITQISDAKTVIEHSDTGPIPFGTLKNIVTDGYQQGGVRFYIYQK